MLTLIAAIKAVPIIDGWVQQLIAAYIMTQTNDTLSKIQDAAALAARATTDAERYAASDAWVAALSRSRFVS
jgi:hypothetical protein